MANETTQPIESIIEQLHSTDWTMRCDAARLLGQSRNPSAVKALNSEGSLLSQSI
jgi:hypothetical protein